MEHMTFVTKCLMRKKSLLASRVESVSTLLRKNRRKLHPLLQLLLASSPCRLHNLVFKRAIKASLSRSSSLCKARGGRKGPHVIHSDHLTLTLCVCASGQEAEREEIQFLNFCWSSEFCTRNFLFLRKDAGIYNKVKVMKEWNR